MWALSKRAKGGKWDNSNTITIKINRLINYLKIIELKIQHNGLGREPKENTK